MVWLYPSLRRITSIVDSNHERILYMTQSPDGTDICTSGPDKQVKFWSIFEPPDKGQMTKCPTTVDKVLEIPVYTPNVLASRHLMR